MPRIVQYRDKCIGCNLCYEMWPLRWRMSKTDGKSVLVGGEKKKLVYTTLISEDEVEINKKIADACPVKLIKIQM
jgi:ferredoxin